MHKLQITLILVLATSIFLFGQTPSQKILSSEVKSSEWELLSRAKYRTKYPADWVLDEKGTMGTSFLLFSPLSDANDQFSENVNLLIQDLSEYDLNLDQYAELSEEQIKTIIADGQIILNERKKARGLEFQKMIYTGTQGVFDLKFEQYYWVVGKEAYVLTLTCEADQFDKFQSTGEEIFNWFEIPYFHKPERLGPPPPPPPPPPPEPEVDSIFFSIDSRDFPLAKGCVLNKEVDLMRVCLEEKMLDFIKAEFSYPLTKKDIEKKEIVSIIYWLDKSSRITDIEISPLKNPKIQEEFAKVMGLLNDNVYKMMTSKPARHKPVRIKIQHLIEIDEALLEASK